MRAASPLAAGLLLVVALASCGGDDGSAGGAEPDGGGPAASATADVTVEAFTFAPDPIEVEAGTTITFTNGDDIDHTVTAGTREDPTPEVFDGPLPEEGSTFEVTLDEPGTYDYYCSLHGTTTAGMVGSIVVTG